MSLQEKYLEEIKKAQEESKRLQKSSSAYSKNKLKKLKYYDKNFGIQVRRSMVLKIK